MAHVPAARPQFRENGYFPTDEPTLERALNALMPSNSESNGPMCILDPAPAKAWQSLKRLMPWGASMPRRSPSSSTQSGRAMPVVWSITVCTRT